MSDENVGGLVELPAAVRLFRPAKSAYDDSAMLDAYTADQMRAYATACVEAALSAHGENASAQTPVVDAAMIERAEAAWFSEPRTGNLTVAIQRMLTAALKGAAHESR